MKTAHGILTAAVVLIAAQVAVADEVQFSGSSGSLAAEATFEASGGNLIITLTNTSSADALVPTDILTGVFFSSGASLSTVSATVAAGSVYGFPAITNVGGEWAYAGGINAPGDATQGISASGLGLFGPADRFDTSANYVDNENVGGVDGGIAPAGDNPATGNGGITGQGLIQNSVTFVLSGWTGSLATIGNVYFQYGTALDEPRFGGESTPEPASMVLMGVGAAGLWFARRRKQQAKA